MFLTMALSARAVTPAPDWTAERDQGGSELGTSVAAGDVDGDGTDDVVAGSPDGAVGQILMGQQGGVVTLYLGGAAGPATAPSWEAEPDQLYVDFGASVSAAGDVDGDGTKDVLVGAPNYWGAVPGGALFLYLGPAPGAVPDWSAEPAVAGASLGVSVDLSGDVDGDGYDDVVAGADDWSDGQASEGAVVLHLGSALGPSAVADWWAESDQDAAYLGGSVHAGGDLDGDGASDLIAGSIDYGGALGEEGRVWAWFGPTPGGAADWSVASGQAEARLGGAIGAGDLDGDGYADLVAGASGWDGAVQDDGALFVFRGSAAGLPGAPDQVVASGVSLAGLGISVAVADLDGNGLADVLVGMYKPPAGAVGYVMEGAAVVYRGSAAGMATAPDWAAESDQTSSQFGAALAVGDVDGNGAGDAVVGAYAYDDPNDAEGAVFLFLDPLPPLDQDGDGYDTRTDCDDADAGVYPGATETCDGVDQDCDGAADVPEPVDAPIWYTDDDADGYGDATSTTKDCERPPGTVGRASDCDDGDEAVNPAATELCNDEDDDCDGELDEGACPADPATSAAPGREPVPGGGGCGCTAAGPSGTGWLALLALGAVRRPQRASWRASTS